MVTRGNFRSLLLHIVRLFGTQNMTSHSGTMIPRKFRPSLIDLGGFEPWVTTHSAFSKNLS